MWPRPIQAVVFDMDGLMFDSERVLFEVMVATAPKFGVEVDRELFLSLIGLRLADSRVLLRARLGTDFPLDDFIAAVGVGGREINAVNGVPLKDGVVELLNHLDALGLPAAIATSSAPTMVERNLGQHGLAGRFKAIVARGDYDNGKPSPDPFLKAAERLGVPPENCLALEDSHNGVRAAHAAGMMTIMVPDMLEATEEMRRLTVYIDESLHQVRARL
jgi:beta-phosphoglucomutase-like phosphatase (HAD superfamily)